MATDHPGRISDITLRDMTTKGRYPPGSATYNRNTEHVIECAAPGEDNCRARLAAYEREKNSESSSSHHAPSSGGKGNFLSRLFGRGR